MLEKRCYLNAKLNHLIRSSLTGIDIITYSIKIDSKSTELDFVRGNVKKRISLMISNRFQISSLLIKHLKESQAGFYTCEVSNEYKTLVSTGFVRVQNLGSARLFFSSTRTLFSCV